MKKKKRGEAAKAGTERTRGGRGQREERRKSPERGSGARRERSGAYRDDRDEEAQQQRRRNAKRLDKRRDSIREKRNAASDSDDAKRGGRGRGRPSKADKPSPRGADKRRNSAERRKDTDRNRSRDRGRSAKQSPQRGAGKAKGKDARKSPQRDRSGARKEKNATPSYEVRGARGLVKYKRKQEPVEEETKEKEAPRVVSQQPGGARWVSKADIAAREELARKQQQARVENRTRTTVARIFSKVTEGGGLSEEEVQEALSKVFRQQLLRLAKRRKSRAGKKAPKGATKGKLLSSEDEAAVEQEAKTQSLAVLEAMKCGFLSEEYTVDLDEQFGHRTYRRKQAEASDMDAGELNAEEAKEIDDMADRFHAHCGTSFGLDDVRAFFKSADATKVDRLCRDLKHDIFDGLFTATKTAKTGEFLFLKKD